MQTTSQQSGTAKLTSGALSKRWACDHVRQRSTRFLASVAVKPSPLGYLRMRGLAQQSTGFWSIPASSFRGTQNGRWCSFAPPVPAADDGAKVAGVSAVVVAITAGAAAVVTADELCIVAALPVDASAMRRSTLPMASVMVLDMPPPKQCCRLLPASAPEELLTTTARTHQCAHGYPGLLQSGQRCQRRAGI